MSPPERRIAVIGSNSFSGAYLIAQLLDEPANRVIGLSRSPEYPDCMLAYRRHPRSRFTFHQLDLNEHHPQVLEVLDTFQPQFIVNFAAQGEVRSSFDHPEHHFRTNALAIVRLVHALTLRTYLTRYVQISTPEVYGSHINPIPEGMAFNPSSPYAASKGAADLYITSVSKTFGFPAITIRATNVYGPHQQLYRIIPRTVINIRNNKKIQLQGGGVAVKSYIHIGDVTEGEIAAMLRGENGSVYHLSPDGAGISVREVVETVCKEMGVAFSKHVEIAPERLGQDAAYVIDSARARNSFGWKPKIDFRTGVRETVAWIERDWNTIRALPTEYFHKP
jgi:dTDP-glucose 4,6-dehydratase